MPFVYKFKPCTVELFYEDQLKWLLLKGRQYKCYTVVKYNLSFLFTSVKLHRKLSGSADIWKSCENGVGWWTGECFSESPHFKFIPRINTYFVQHTQKTKDFIKTTIYQPNT